MLGRPTFIVWPGLKCEIFALVISSNFNLNETDIHNKDLDSSLKRDREELGNDLLS